MSGSHVIAPDIGLAVSHGCPVGDQQAARPEGCSAFAENATSGTRKALSHCVEHGFRFLDPFSQASRAKSVVALARSLQLQHSTFSTCTIHLCSGLDSCHVLDACTLTSSRIWVTWPPWCPCRVPGFCDDTRHGPCTRFQRH